ncbi:hypothetical protein [Chitinimonas koreensis]|uniref:hypothetical protein n=1 Tax=Chitinimonas koreensis TaxID=356302 RepID=UPI0004127118|nr:hypothetical protein [Chitinimonas koreensis]QNM97376.1 hypothetical protein H9L41_03410 [Chitinimonas koreensis]
MKNGVRVAYRSGAIGLAGLLAVPAQAAVLDGCISGVSVVVVGAQANYVKESFTPQCSKAISLKYQDNGTDITAKAASAKGMHTFGGSSFTGSVFQCESSSVALPHSSISPSLTGC